MVLESIITPFFQSQIREWELAKTNFSALAKVDVRTIKVGDLELYLQCNPKRIVSSSAKIDTKSLAERPCFLCSKNLPKEQKGIALNEKFTLLVNPFPILKKHFTIVNNAHTPQKIQPYFYELLEITRQLGSEYTLFYNGAKCGASAPDHMHFQAGSTEQFPVWKWLQKIDLKKLFIGDGCSVYSFSEHINGLVISGKKEEGIKRVLEKVMKSFATLQTEDEPMINLLSSFQDEWKIIVFPRQKHRPSQYFEQGDKQFLLSPASVDFGGLIAIARVEDFQRIDEPLLQDVFAQLRLDSQLFEQLEQKIKIL